MKIPRVFRHSRNIDLPTRQPDWFLSGNHIGEDEVNVNEDADQVNGLANRLSSCFEDVGRRAGKLEKAKRKSHIAIEICERRLDRNKSTGGSWINDIRLTKRMESTEKVKLNQFKYDCAVLGANIAKDEFILALEKFALEHPEQSQTLRENLTSALELTEQIPKPLPPYEEPSDA